VHGSTDKQMLRLDVRSIAAYKKSILKQHKLTLCVSKSQVYSVGMLIFVGESGLQQMTSVY
jgi:hypothetical protein